LFLFGVFSSVYLVIAGWGRNKWLEETLLTH